jgi:DUF4097 and DUF4098 domain-containing protein YvlB
MKPVVKVLVLVAVLGFLLLGSAVFVGACAYTHLRIGSGSFHSGVEASRVETHELALDPGQPLRAQVDCGSIRVTSSSGTAARLVAHLRAFGEDKEAAGKLLAAMSLELGQNSIAGHEQREHSRKFFESGGGEQIDLELALPAGTTLELHSGSGDVTLEGPFGDTQAGSDYGDVAASGIRGALVLKSSSGEIQASDIEGASVRVETNYGDIELHRLQASRIEAHTSSGKIEARQLRSELVRLDSDYGDIAVRELQGDLESKTSSGEVSIREASGACRAHSNYGDVTAEGVFRGLSLSSSSGSVTGKAGAGSLLGDGWELTSEYGEVHLALPEGLSFELDASTDYGEVRAHLPGVLGGSKGDEPKHLHGAVGQGGPRLRLHSSSGDVEIGTR